MQAITVCVFSSRKRRMRNIESAVDDIFEENVDPSMEEPNSSVFVNSRLAGRLGNRDDHKKKPKGRVDGKDLRDVLNQDLDEVAKDKGNTI